MVKSFLAKMSLALCFLALFSLKLIDISTGELGREYPLEIGWKAVGVPLKEVSTETWMQLNRKWMSIYELKELTQKLQGKLGMTSRVKPTCGQQDGMTYASFENKIKDGTVMTLTIQSMRDETSDETQLGINTSLTGPIKDVGGYVSHLKALIAGIGGEPHVKVMLFGEYKGALTANVIKEFSSRVFQKMQAQYVNSSYIAGNSNQKGYTPLIKDSTTYENKKFNVEICTRYDGERKITQIVLATPCFNDEM